MVTGAAGFVGRHLMAAVHATWPNVAVIEGPVDVSDSAGVAQAVREAAPTCCVHLAGVTSVAHAARAKSEAWQVNLHGTLNMAEAILTHVPDCQMIFASSADVYGASFRVGVPINETANLAPTSLYGATKAAADLALGCLAEQGLRVVRLRLFNHIGAGQSPDFVIASFARQLARIGAGLQPPTLQVGRLDTYRDFLDVRDVCAAYIACIARRNILPSGEVLNIASGRARRIGDVLDEMVALSGASIKLCIDDQRVRGHDILRASGDAHRAASLLDWTPSIDWQDTLLAVLHDWQERVA